MANPNERNHPKYYGGKHWYTGLGDNGGVHRNSGVFNFWFYMVVEGAEGMNENEYNFQVEGLGWKKALDLVFGMHRYYLTENSDYAETMYLSLEMCEDLFGPESEEEKIILEAWLAVGLFPGIDELDLTISLIDERINLCPDEEGKISVCIKNTGTQDFPQGTALNVSFLQNKGDTIVEQVELPMIMSVGDTVVYQFETALINDPEFDGTFKVFLEQTDLSSLNNQDRGTIHVSERSGLDIELLDFDFLTNGDCGSNILSQYSYALENLGCETIHKEDTIYFDVVTNDGSFSLPRKIFFDFQPGSTQTGRAEIPYDLLPFEVQSFTVDFNHNGDNNSANNQIEKDLILPGFVQEGYAENFESEVDFTKINIEIRDNFTKDSIVEYRGNKMLAIAAINDNSFFQNCEDASGFFEAFPIESKVSFCVNAIGLQEPVFEFSMIQLLNQMRTTEIINEDFGVLVQVQTETENFPIIYAQGNDQLHKHSFNLTKDYSGDVVIAIVVVNADSSTEDLPFLSNKDVVLLDDIRLFDKYKEDQKYDDDGYLLYPNPSFNYLRLDQINKDILFDVLIYNDIGELIYSVDSISRELTINTTDFANGIYFIQILERGELISSKKFIKVR